MQREPDSPPDRRRQSNECWTYPKRSPRKWAGVADLVVMIWLMFPALPSSLLGLRTDSLTIDGMLYRGPGPVPQITIRAFAHQDSCTGPFVEVATDEAGRFHFYREYSQKDFPEDGVCKYEVTVCYADSGEWRRLSRAGTSGPCGGSDRIEFDCNLERPDPKCTTKFSW
jgi:hypothetical protein